LILSIIDRYMCGVLYRTCTAVNSILRDSGHETWDSSVRGLSCRGLSWGYHVGNTATTDLDMGWAGPSMDPKICIMLRV